MKKQGCSKGIALALLCLGLLMLAQAVPASEAVREGFEKVEAAGTVKGWDGEGWSYPGTNFRVRNPVRVERRVPFQRAARGVIAFDLQRVDADLERDQRSVFLLEDAAGQKLLLVQIDWTSVYDPTLPMLRLTGGPYFEEGIGWWSPWILLDEPVEAGQWIHVELTWDDDASKYELYVNGRLQDTTPKFYDAVQKDIDPDPRQVTNQVEVREGRPPRYVPHRFGDLLERAKTLRFGINWSPGDEEATSPLANAVLDNFVIAVGEAAVPVSAVHGPEYDPRDLRASVGPEGVELTWEPPEKRGVNQGYWVYRREGAGRFEKLTPERVYDLTFTDTTAEQGKTYRYSVTAVFGDGRGGDVESKYPPEVTVTVADLAVAELGAEKALYGAGQEIGVTLRGAADKTATFTIEGLAAEVAMTEVDDGVYVGKVAVPEGANGSFALMGTLTDPATGEAASLEGPTITIDTTAPDPVPAGRILATSPWPGEIEVTWEASPSADVDHYEIYRGEGADPDLSADPYESIRKLSFTDTAVVAGLEYRYAVVAVDRAGNRSEASDIVSAEAVAGEGPAITGVTMEPFGKPVKPGENVTITVTGQSGATVTADLGTLAAGLPLTEAGRTGRYTGTYTVTDADVGPTKTLHRVVVHVADAYGSSERAGPELAVVGLDALNDTTPPVIASAENDFFSVAGFSGRLVAGDVLTVTMKGEAGGYASFSIEGVAADVPMTEVEPGTYRGAYTVEWDDEGTEVPVMVRLADDAGNETTQAAGRPVSFDTRVRLVVTARDTLLPADRKSTTRLVAKAVDANGDEVSGHELALTLSTTSEYTGVVGGGRIEGKEARMEDADDVEVRWGGVTDAFGEVTATYTAGFAAKTALIVAKDLTTGDVGAGWLHTYVASTVAIELVPRARKGMEDRAVLRVTAEPAKLTADGRSTSRIKALLLDLQGNPIEGARVRFALGNDNGRLRVLRGGRTDGRGLAEAEYRAGTAIGTVTITASAKEWGVTGSVQIVLMSDAPAKIDLVAEAERLPADGRSETGLSVRVTDIHGNPNHEVPVAFTVLRGDGEVGPATVLTDRNGEARVVFRAGRRPGTVVVEARHTSREPTDAELRRIYGTVFVPRLEERQERDRIKVSEWLVEPGDEVEKGEPIVILEGRKASWTLTAPEKGVFVRRVKHRRDRVELGDTLGYVEIDEDVWKDEYVGTLGR
ncbi:Ig-like domain-containing protein [Deferrisoma camini]|uniref:Ig-like domain-containing protein n=1 Tax=Deferrisoma camini TaxID=1035120 RepID=UPI00046D1541|nr:Ig-like domain-containing protein [Deferrisoma camini]